MKVSISMCLYFAKTEVYTYINKSCALQYLPLKCSLGYYNNADTSNIRQGELKLFL